MRGWGKERGSGSPRKPAKILFEAFIRLMKVHGQAERTFTMLNNNVWRLATHLKTRETSLFGLFKKREEEKRFNFPADVPKNNSIIYYFFS